jgi:DNA-binding response OmpR family regulator
MAVQKEQVRYILDGVHVLLVEDNRSFGDMVGIALDYAGARVTKATSAREGLSRLATGDVDVLVSDLSMPMEDGLWLIGEVRRNTWFGALPAILVTGFGSEHFKERAAAEGYDLYVEKPFDVWEFCDTVHQVLRKKNRR